MGLILISLLRSLIPTLIVELYLAAALRVRSGKDLVVIALANVLTNPIVNYCYYWAIYLFSEHSIYTWLILLVLEVFAVAAEFLIYRALLSYDRVGKLKLSLLLNGASFLFGLMLTVLMQL